MLNTFKRAGLALSGLLFLACGGAPAPAPAAPADQLDAAIRETSDYLNKQLPPGNKLVILNIQSDFPALSEYIIDELIANTVNDEVFSVVDRRQLDAIRAELNFQMSGEVDDATAQALGRLAGAQIIVSGAVSRIGELYRLRVRALSVQSAEIEGQFNRNIPEGATIAALVKSQATGYGGGNYGGSGGAGAEKPGAASAAAPAQAVPKEYQTGDIGPAGGIVFYDKGVHVEGWRYLEAASRNIGSGSPWDINGRSVGGTGTAVGTGKQNTEIMADAGITAGQIAKQYSQGGYNDWFLPSKDELDFMYRNLKQRGLGNFGGGQYWSSSVYGGSLAWAQSFSDGSQTPPHMNTRSIRAVRQF